MKEFIQKSLETELDIKSMGKNDENDNSYSRDISNLEEKVISMYGLEKRHKEILNIYSRNL